MPFISFHTGNCRRSHILLPHNRTFSATKGGKQRGGTGGDEATTGGDENRLESSPCSRCSPGHSCSLQGGIRIYPTTEQMESLRNSGDGGDDKLAGKLTLQIGQVIL